MAKVTPSRATDAPTAGALARVQEFVKELAGLFAILGAVAVVGAGAVYVWIPELRTFALVVVAMGAALLVVALASSFGSVRSAVLGHRGRVAANAVVLLLVFTTLMVLVNFISFRNPFRWDSTASKQFSLSKQTVAVLENLPEAVTAVAFFSPSQTQYAGDRQQADDLLYEFRQRSQGNLTYRFVDPELNPGEARQRGVTRFPVIIFETEQSQKQFPVFVPPVTEQDLTSALLIITGAKQKKVYFLVGHNERDINDVDETSRGFGFAARGLINDNYRVSTLNLKQAGQVPDDAAALVVAGPADDLQEDEYQPLFDWLKKGGRALFLMDPGSYPRFQKLLAQWAVEVKPGSIVDPASSVHGSPRSPLLQRGQYIPGVDIVQPLDVTFFPVAAPLDIGLPQDKIPPWIQYMPMAATTTQSWATTDANRDTFDSSKDKLGPQLLAMAVQALSTADEEPSAAAQAQGTKPDTKLVVIGDSDFTTNVFYSAYSNGDLLLNSVNWLTEDYALISIRPKPIAFRELVLTRQEYNFLRYASWFLLPAAVAMLGLVTWWRRR